VVESHSEPTAFPHDRRLRRTTTWHRLVWPSLVGQIKTSYEVAKWDLPTYYRLAQNAQDKMRGWASPPAVAERLYAALDMVARTPAERNSPEQFRTRRAAA
jgi:hypothetical protein